MLDVAFQTLGVFISRYQRTGEVPYRTGNRQPGEQYAPYNSYPTVDGHILIFCQNDESWRKLLKVMGRIDLLEDPRYQTSSDRIQHIDEVDDIVREWTESRSKKKAAELIMAAGIPCGPVNNLDEVLDDPHLTGRGTSFVMDHPRAGPIRAAGPPLKMSRTPPDITDPSPALGQHTHEVLVDLLGYSDKDLKRLQTEGVI
jgi:crotonobetainyl-CoA:carnitine CoA-transferase CaiB-like acyl-CoA transferase